MRLTSIISIFCITVIMSGCSHNINLTPDYGDIEIINHETKEFIQSDEPVAYYLSTEKRETVVTSPAGGGDSVTYSPYKDLNSVIYSALSLHFADVSYIKSLDNDKDLANIRYIFTPTIETTSYSSSALHWPPTKFSITLKMEALNEKKEVVWSKLIKSEGNAEYSDYKSDVDFSAKQASENLYKALTEELSKFPK
ncbi:hypothetical protein [Vibrio methylphosphonaticus]|uniref:hypothetical protein n=1 Tax=Vibrio methylphosphonaticus TaxID=2946866 RepID=UPI00202AB6C9|nr:hypothetical protein [Vibrio methylphosphonaticus]MCL9774586.1 hypothetical protein [Vibrio methylphosphonaticus]